MCKWFRSFEGYWWIMEPNVSELVTNLETKIYQDFILNKAFLLNKRLLIPFIVTWNLLLAAKRSWLTLSPVVLPLRSPFSTSSSLVSLCCKFTHVWGSIWSHWMRNPHNGARGYQPLKVISNHFHWLVTDSAAALPSKHIWRKYSMKKKKKKKHQL